MELMEEATAQNSAWVYQGKREIWIHKDYHNHQELATKLNLFIEDLPLKLKAPLRYLVVRPDILKNGGREAAGRCLYKQGGVVLFRTTRFKGPWLSTWLLAHECAHLAGDITGPPKALKEEWREARRLDQIHQKSLANLPITVEVDKVIQPLAMGSPWINRYAATRTRPRRVREDWAEAVTYYLLDQSRQTFSGRHRFQELFPNRKALVEHFLG